MPKAMMCPFYKHDEKATLRCDAGLLEFLTLEQKIEYINKYCAAIDGYEHCTLASSLLRLYDKYDKKK